MRLLRETEAILRCVTTLRLAAYAAAIPALALGAACSSGGGSGASRDAATGTGDARSAEAGPDGGRGDATGDAAGDGAVPGDAACSSGVCATDLAAGQGAAPNAVGDLLVDATNVYWIPAGGDPANGSIVTVPKAGGAVVTVASGIAGAQGLAQDATNLYVVSHNVGVASVGKPGTPGASGTLTYLLRDGTLDAGVFPEFWLLPAAPDLYVVGGLAAGLFDLPADGGGIPVAVAAAASLVGAPGTGYYAVAADDGGLYYDTTSQIVIVDRKTNAQVGVVPGSSATAGTRFGPTVAVDSDFIYFVSNVAGDGGLASSLARVPKAGGAVTVLTAASVAFDDGPIAVDGTAVYWTHLTSAAPRTAVVLAVPKAGGAVVTASTSCYANCPFALDATAIYWPGADGTIRSAKKPL